MKTQTLKKDMEEKDKFLMHPKKFEALEKRVETLEKKHQDLIDNLRIFMVNEDEEKEYENKKT